MNNLFTSESIGNGTIDKLTKGESTEEYADGKLHVIYGGVHFPGNAG